ncbi:MAG: 50S ribosomal protein L29 [Candidatus Kerfeldbacteria bacterium]|nr:50S ribosomal protein L29 [Candidatus Kerfeldbacteria bacterium]
MPKRRDQLNELRHHGRPELQRLLAASREALRDLRFRVAANQHKDVREIRELRARIARIQTFMKHLRSSSET